MTTLNSGELLALGGLVLLLLHNLVIRPLLKSRRPARGLGLFWLNWGDLAVFLVILAGLTLIWAQK